MHAWDAVRAFFIQIFHFPKPWVILGDIPDPQPPRPPLMRCEVPGCCGRISKRGAAVAGHWGCEGLLSIAEISKKSVVLSTLATNFLFLGLEELVPVIR